ncbi:MAG TPA: flagellar hook-basal body complex protein FliE [Terriglobales bacterium]|jgi:flagellar hook-basal body complex protein FliE
MSVISSGLPIVSGTAPTSPSGPVGAESSEGGFGASLRDAMNHVDQMSQDSQGQVSDLLQGNRSDIQNVMIAVEKADVAFQLMMQVRNKIVNAYDEISKMQF